MDKDQVGKLVLALRDIREELIKLEGDDVLDKTRYYLYPPADPSAISQFEEKIGSSFPPSYQAFLELHNGWLGFWPDWSLVGLPSDDNTDMYEDIEETLKIIPDELNEKKRAILTEEEKTDPMRILATNHLIFATDFNGGLMVFDQNRRDSGGEMEVARVGYIYNVTRRYPNFISLLEYAIDDTRLDVEKLRNKM